MKYNARHASFKMGGRVPTNNATQMSNTIVKTLGSKQGQKLSRSAQRTLAKTVKALGKSQQTTSRAAIEGLRDTAVSLGSSYGAMKAYEKNQDTQLAKRALQSGSNSNYDRALQEWNGVINLTPEDPYVEGNEGAVGGQATTGSILGG